MSKKFVRSVKDVTDIEKFSKNVLELNDIISTQAGEVYIKSVNGFIELGNTFDDTSLKQEIKSLKSEITNLKTKNSKLDTRVTTLETDYKTLSDRVTALETPATTE